MVAKRWNIRLSLALLAVLAVIFARQFPPLVAVNLTGIVAFGYFVFKAGYAQSELLFYFLFFLTFLAFWSLLRRRERPVPLWLACAAGAFAGLAHLTKAAMFPFVALFAGVFTVFALVGPARHRGASLVRAVAVPVVVGATFLALLSPYLVNSKRTFGRYFYHVTLFYVWYDNWAQASVGMCRHGDGVGWPDMPADQIPSAAKYWRSHTVGQIAARVAGGFKDMAVRSYRTYGYLKYVVLFLDPADGGHALEHVGVHQSSCARTWRSPFFWSCSGVSHLLLIAFYEPISGTGTTRFLIGHLTPFFYTASRYLAHPAVAATRWTIANRPVRSAASARAYGGHARPGHRVRHLAAR